MTTPFDDTPPDSISDPQTSATPPRAADEGATPSGDEPPPGRRRWILAAMGALALALFAVPLLRGPDAHDDLAGPAEETRVAADGTCGGDRGTAKLDFTLTDMEGAKVHLSDYRGKVILLNFWATWCPPCKVEIPDFAEVYAEYRDRGLVILGVLNLDDPTDEELRAFATQYGINYPVFRASDEFEAANGPIWGLPTTFLIDRQGAICAKHMGPVSKETVEREIKGLL